MMSDPVNYQNLSGQCVNDTTGHPSLVPNSAIVDLDHPEGIDAAYDQGMVDATLSLNSASSLTSQYAAMPMLGQLGLHQHVAEGRFRRSSLSVPCGVPGHSRYDPHSMLPQNTININISMGSNSSVNINLLNNNSHSQFTGNNSWESSSSVEPVRNDVISAAASKYEQPFLSLAPKQEPIWDDILETKNSSLLTSPYSKYASPSANALTGKAQAMSTCFPDYEHEAPRAISCLRQEMIMSSVHQGQRCPPFQNIAFQRDSVLSTYFYNKKHYNLPARPSPTVNLVANGEINFHDGNDALLETGHHSQPYIRTHPGTYPNTTQHVRELVPDPTKRNCFAPACLQTLSIAPPENDIVTESQGNVPQDTSSNLNPLALGNQRPSVRHKSNPYVKHGPYTCPHCDAIFESGHCFSAHFQNHYRDESPTESKRRRQGKTKMRDLRIARSTAGITVIPRSSQLEDELPVTSNTSNKRATKIKLEGGGFASVKVKEEVMSD